MLQTISRPLRQLALQQVPVASCSYSCSASSEHEAVSMRSQALATWTQRHGPHPSSRSPLLVQLVNKLLYRSRQRGFLELDLLMGKYAERELPRMGSEQLLQFSGVLDEVRQACLRTKMSATLPCLT